jgi:hypothetical protein
MEKNMFMRKPDPETKVGLRGREATSRNPGVNAPKDESMRENSPANLPEENNKPTGESRRPLTNQDEQRNIFNGDNNGNPLGEKETEGD